MKRAVWICDDFGHFPTPYGDESDVPWPYEPTIREACQRNWLAGNPATWEDVLPFIVEVNAEIEIGKLEIDLGITPDTGDGQ